VRFKTLQRGGQDFCQYGLYLISYSGIREPQNF